MRTVVVDIMEFDKTPVVYFFDQQDLNNPVQTIADLVANPSSFKQRPGGDYKAVLTWGQNDRLLAYLRKGNYRLQNFGKGENLDQLLAFSFGENPDVNMQLATVVNQAMTGQPSLRIVVQWEIADILYERNPRCRSTVARVDLDSDKVYITTGEVVEKAIQSKAVLQDARTCVVCQAWHAPRCVQTCRDHGLKVVRGEFIDAFSPSDPQKWVRNWLAWVLKEGTK